MNPLRPLVLLGAALALASAAYAEPAPLGRAPTTVTMSVQIDAPVERVWDELARIGDIYLNSPTVDRSVTSSAITEGVGATRHMEMSIAKDATLDERVIAWDEGRSMTLEVYQMAGITGVQTMAGAFVVAPVGDHTVLTSTLYYSMSNGFFGTMNRLMLKQKFAALWTSVLAGYKHHIETGEPVTTETELDLDAVEVQSIEVDVNGDGRPATRTVSDATPPSPHLATH